MALDTFTPPRKVSTQSTVEEAPRVNSVVFGDGYSQRSQDGLNASNETFSGQCNGLTKTQADTVIAFFRGHTVSAFLWNMPIDSVQRKFIAAKWSRAFMGSGLQSISFTFQEVFDL